MDRLDTFRTGIEDTVRFCNKLAEAVEALQAENAELKRKLYVLKDHTQSGLPAGFGVPGWEKP